MKIRTARYVIKEGILNSYKNKLMSLASISIVVASLILYGIFLLFIINLKHNAKILNEQPQMQVFCEYELDETQVNQVEKSIKENENVQECKTITAKEALEKFKMDMGEDAEVLEGYDESLLPVSFVIKLKDPGKSADSAEEIKKIEGVNKVKYSQEIIDFFAKFTYWINIISGFLIVLLLVISVFIIANTIKLTVFARRKEINIMKYIGATDWFIRWPFIVEGVIIGVVGAIIAFVLTSYGYSSLEKKYSSELLNVTMNFIKLVKMGEVGFRILMLYSLLGSVVGAIGSFISIRKYLRV